MLKINRNQQEAANSNEPQDFELDDNYLDTGSDADFDFFSDEDDAEEEEADGSQPKASKKWTIALAAVAIVVIVVIVFGIVSHFRGGGKEPDQNEPSQQEEVQRSESGGDNTVVTESGLVYRNPEKNSDDTLSENREDVPEEPKVNANGLTDDEEDMYNDALGIGVQNLTGNIVHENNTPITEGDFTRDYNSTDIPMYYEIKSIRQVQDYISYTKYRTTTADGIELYWLDGSYHGKPVRLTTTLSVFKELSASGVIPVIVEVTVTKDGNQLITGFTVDTTTAPSR